MYFDTRHWRCAVLKARGEQSRPFSGGHGEGETPLPIPNRAVKPLSADGTWPSRAWESRTPPVFPSRAASGRLVVVGGAERPSAPQQRADGGRLGRAQPAEDGCGLLRVELLARRDRERPPPVRRGGEELRVAGEVARVAPHRPAPRAVAEDGQAGPVASGPWGL